MSFFSFKTSQALYNLYCSLSSYYCVLFVLCASQWCSFGAWADMFYTKPKFKMENIWANTHRKWCHHVWVTMDPSPGSHGMNWTQRRKIYFLISSMLTPTRIHDQIQIRKSSWQKVSVYENSHRQGSMTGGPFIQTWYMVSDQNLLPRLIYHTCVYPCFVKRCFGFGWPFIPAFALAEDTADMTADLVHIQLEAVQLRLFTSVLSLSFPTISLQLL